MKILLAVQTRAFLTICCYRWCQWCNKYLEKSFKALFEWFKNNFLKSNADKCHLFVKILSIRLSEYDVRKREWEILLGNKFCTKLYHREL